MQSAVAATGLSIQHTLNKNIKIFLNWFLGPALLVWLGISLYHQISRQPQSQQSWQHIKDAFVNSQSWKIYIACALMLANWGLESFKWQLLVRPVQKVSFFTAVKAVLAGTTLSATTPNRVGEYLGRIIYMNEGNRLRSIAVTIVGSYSQLLVTLVAGCTGLLFFVYQPTVASTYGGGGVFWMKVCLCVLAVAALLAILVYFKLSLVVKMLERIPFVQKYRFFLAAVEEIALPVLLKTLALSALRYAVFLVQYILVMDAFGLPLTISLHCCLLSVMFLVLAVIPSFVLAEVGIRGKISTFIYGTVGGSVLTVFSAGFFIWLLNLILPAVAGGLLLLGKRIFKKEPE
jgi:hypothetical protein